jgi:hypothetical protein
MQRDVAAAIAGAARREDMQGLLAAEGLFGIHRDHRARIERGFAPGRGGMLARQMRFEVLDEQWARAIGGDRGSGHEQSRTQEPGPAPFARKWGVSPFHGWATEMIR